MSPAETVIRAVVADPVLTSIERKRAHGWVSEEQKKEISYLCVVGRESQKKRRAFLYALKGNLFFCVRVRF